MTAQPPHLSSRKLTPLQQDGPFESIDSKELALRWGVPVSWVRDQVRSRAVDPIPHVRLGKYVRFEWDSPQLQAWWVRHRNPSNAQY